MNRLDELLKSQRLSIKFSIVEISKIINQRYKYGV